MTSSPPVQSDDQKESSLVEGAGRDAAPDATSSSRPETQMQQEIGGSVEQSKRVQVLHGEHKLTGCDRGGHS